MAVEEINAKGGVLGRKIEVVSRDDGGNPGAGYIRLALVSDSESTAEALHRLVETLD